MTKAKLQSAVQLEGQFLLPQQHRHPSYLQHSTTRTVLILLTSGSRRWEETAVVGRYCYVVEAEQKREENNKHLTVCSHPNWTETQTHL